MELPVSSSNTASRWLSGLHEIQSTYPPASGSAKRRRRVFQSQMSTPKLEADVTASFVPSGERAMLNERDKGPGAGPMVGSGGETSVPVAISKVTISRLVLNVTNCRPSGMKLAPAGP